MTYIAGPSLTSTNGNSVSTIGGAVVNNAGLDPFQGYDASVWVLDQATGKYNLVGEFTSVQVTVQNATEPYLELNQRIPRYLDGELQIGWVLERGMIDVRILQQTFGISTLSRELKLSRNSRFQIVFEINAPELDRVNNTVSAGRGSVGNGGLLVYPSQAGTFSQPKAKGQIRLSNCKIDSLTFGATAGRNVIANRWEGLAEGIEEVSTTSVWAGTALGSTQTAQDSFQNIGTVNQGLAGSQAGRPIGVSSTVLSSNGTADGF